MAARRCPICRAPHHRLGNDNPLRALKRAPAGFAGLLRRAPRRLLSRRPGRGQWSVGEVMAHVADAEVSVAFRLRKIACEPGAVIPAWDQDRWAEGGRYRRTPPAEPLGVFSALRRANLAYASRLGPAQRGHHGRHPEYGWLTIRQVLTHLAEHDLNHLEQMRSALSSLARRT